MMAELKSMHAGASDRPQKEIKVMNVTMHANPLAE
jgi:hypothetical protein